MTFSRADKENYAVTESDFSDYSACTTEMGEGTIEVDDVGVIVQTSDKWFHGGMTGGFIVA